MKKIGLTLVVACFSATLFAQNEANSKRLQIANIFEKGSEAQKDSMKNVIVADAKSNKNESELDFFNNVLRYGKFTKEAAVVEARAIKLFPRGTTARGKDIQKYNKLESLKEKQKLYDAIIKKYPQKEDEDGIAYDYMTSSLAQDLIEDGQKEKGLRYLQNMKERFWRAQAYMPIAKILLNEGDTATAIPLIQTSLDDALYYIKMENPDNKARFAAVGYPGYVQAYAAVLLAQGKGAEALNYIEEAKKIVPDRSEEFAPGYAKALSLAGRDLEAFNQYSILYRDGQFGYAEPLEQLYIKLNKGQRTGFDEYTAQLKADLNEKIKNHLSQIVTEKETPEFKLRNLKGELVDSKTLLGKVVVLDFWATWCGPCVRSFPGMQKAVTKYEKDPDVVFLFIDTWERDEDYEQKVNDFIQKHKYTFNVLFDDGKTQENLVPKFGIKGIPAKFIIDKKGKIRFALTGSSPYPDYILMELTQMIEFARKG